MKLVKSLESDFCEGWLRDVKLCSLWKRRLKGDLITLYKCMKTWWVLVSSSRQATTEDGPKLCQGRFRLGIRNNFLTEEVVKHWHGLPREGVESPSLGVFQKWLDVAWCYALIDVVLVQSQVGLTDLEGLCQP